MSANITTELKVPDLWFDFYARFLPGAAFVAAVMYIVVGCNKWPNTLQTGLLLAGGFFCAMLTQPAASRATGLLERLAECLYQADEFVILRAQLKCGYDSQQSMVLSKMHGEVTFFAQVAVLSECLYIAAWFVHGCPWALGLGPLLFGTVCAGLGLEVACRRLKRAQRILRGTLPDPSFRIDWKRSLTCLFDCIEKLIGRNE